MNNIKLDEIELNDTLISSEIDFYESAFKAKRYEFYFDKEIDSPDNYRNFYKICKEANEYDMINCIFNTPGGSVGTAIQLINCLLKTDAQTYAEIYKANSAGFLIALVCDNLIINKFSEMMIHPCSLFGLNGKINDVVEYTNHITKQHKEILEFVCKDFLTKDEIKNVLIGKELYFDEKELIKRNNKRKAFRENM